MKLRRQHIRFFFGWAIGIGIALGIMTCFAFAWVYAGPRSLDRFTPYIESSLNATDGSYTVKVAETWLMWDGWQHPFDIRLRDVAVFGRDGEKISAFPEIAVGLHVPSLIAGRLLPTSLIVSHPIISLLQNEDQSIGFGFQPVEAQAGAQAALPAAVLLDQIINPRDTKLRKLRYFAIRDASVSIGSLAKGVFFEASNVEFAARRRKGAVEFDVGGRVRYGDYQSSAGAHLLLDKARAVIEGDIEFRGVETSTLASLFTHRLEMIPFNLPISGNVQVKMDVAGALHYAKFNIEGGMGEISAPQLLKPLPIGWAHVQGQVSNDGKDIQVDSLSADIDGMPLTAKGVVMLANGDASIRAEAAIENVPMEKVPLLWPPKLAPLSREWVTENISGGMIPVASIRTNIQFGDLAKPVLPKEAVDAAITLVGAKVKYLPEHPETSQVKAVVHVDGMALDAAIESAHFMKETKITNGRVLIEDLNPDNPYIKLNFDAETSARELVKFLDLPRLKHTQRLNLKEEGAEGTVKGTAALGFYFFAPKDATGEPEITYDVKAEASGVAQPDFMKKFAIKNASGAMTVNNRQVEFIGKGEVNGATAKGATIRYTFTPENGFDTFIDVDATAPKASLPRFGYPDFPFLKGTLGVQAKVKLGANHEISQATINLTNAEVDAQAIAWNKPDKEPATLDLSVEKKNGVTSINAFHLKAQDIEAKGAAGFNAALTDITRLSMDKLMLGNTQLSTLKYELQPGGYVIEASGKSLDMSGYFSARDKKKNNDFSFEQFPAVQFKGAIERVIMAGGRSVSNFKGDLLCTQRICEHADLSGTIGGKPFDLRIMRNPRGKRQFALHAQNAGDFLKAMDIYDKMDGGDLSITGNYEDTPTDSVLRARLDISEHALKKAPVLAKILSLASLTGFIDVLEGNGIRFTKMVIPFTLRNDVITVDKARAFGSAIGITAEGTITMPKGLFDIRGTVVPAYTINSVLGKVPLLGDVLTGGDGKGIFAANYKVKGDYENPEVSVNPLSILAPGFLRGIFEGSDKPGKD